MFRFLLCTGSMVHNAADGRLEPAGSVQQPVVRIGADHTIRRRCIQQVLRRGREKRRQQGDDRQTFVISIRLQQPFLHCSTSRTCGQQSGREISMSAGSKGKPDTAYEPCSSAKKDMIGGHERDAAACRSARRAGRYAPGVLPVVTSLNPALSPVFDFGGQPIWLAFLLCSQVFQPHEK